MSKKLLAQAHVSSTRYHGSKKLTLQRVLWEGYWWLTLNEDVAKFVNVDKDQPMNNEPSKTPK